MVKKYGNLPLGQVYKLLVSIIGRDAALVIAEDMEKSIVRKNPDKNYKDPNKKFTDIKRYYEENGTSFAHFRPSEETGAMELVRNFFNKLEKQYGFPENVGLLTITAFFGVHRNALRALTPYEKQTKDITLHLFNWFLGYLSIPIKDSGRQDKYTIQKGSVKGLLTDTYYTVFDKIYKNLEINKTQFYEEVRKFYTRKPLSAFDKGRNFAGAYFKAFLEESIAATVYFNRRRIQDIPKEYIILREMKKDRSNIERFSCKN